MTDPVVDLFAQKRDALMASLRQLSDFLQEMKLSGKLTLGLSAGDLDKLGKAASIKTRDGKISVIPFDDPTDRRIIAPPQGTPGRILGLKR